MIFYQKQSQFEKRLYQMKNSKLISIFLFFFYVIIVSNSHSQNAWFRQDSISDMGIYGLDFINENTGMICGSRARLYRTINGGQNWNRLPAIDSVMFYEDINMVNYDNIFYYSNGGNIYKSSNSGLNWTIIHATDFGIESLNMCDMNYGYLAGMSLNYPDNTRYVLKTINGGLNWNTVFKFSQFKFL